MNLVCVSRDCSAFLKAERMSSGVVLAWDEELVPNRKARDLKQMKLARKER